MSETKKVDGSAVKFQYDPKKNKPQHKALKPKSLPGIPLDNLTVAFISRLRIDQYDSIAALPFYADVLPEWVPDYIKAREAEAAATIRATKTAKEGK